MAEVQFLVRLLNGRTRCVQFSDPAVSCEDLKSRLFEIERIPCELQRIVSGTREIQEGEVIDENVGTLSLLLRLRGGKGGFGSLLRASKARQKKINNFDACRDMSGRRLRHVNAEKKVQEWHEEAPLRELEATAMEYLTKKSKEMKAEASTVDELKKFREQAMQNALDVQEAVLDGLKRSGKRKKNGGGSDRADKKSKKIADDDKDEDMLIAKPSSSVQNVPDNQPVAAVRQSIEMKQPETKDEAELQPATPAQVEQLIPPAPVLEEVKANTWRDTKAEVQLGKPEEPAAELSFEVIQSVKDLEGLGLERLKAELQQRGLKCSGSLAERAARLFLLKSTPLEKLGKKHFAAKTRSTN